MRPSGAFLRLTALLAVAALVALRAIGDSTLGVPDADRILMDGVFVRDFLHDLPLWDVYSYAVDYYAQYPALSIGYRPPFFPLFEGIANAAFGIEQWSSRLALTGFWLAGLAGWFLLVRRTHDEDVAFWSGMLLATCPFVVQWGWYTMAELPVLALTMLTAWAFQRYLDDDRGRWLILAALLLGLAMWTKQTAVFAALWLSLVLILGGRLPATIRRRSTWVAVLVLLAFALPLLAMTLWLGEKNIAQSVGTGAAAAPSARLPWKNLLFYPLHLWIEQIPRPVLLLSALGIALALRARMAYTGLFLLWIGAVYAVFTYLTAKESRYVLFWIPPLLLFATLPLMVLRESRLGRLVAHGSLALLIGYQLYAIYSTPPRSATGYAEAARFALSESESRTLFFDGYNNGYFIWEVRRHDAERRFRVLRGDKTLSASSIKANSYLTVLARDAEDIRRVLDDNGVELAVVESNQDFGIPIHRELRRFLREGPFELLHEIPVVATGRAPLANQRLLIYRYLERKQGTGGKLAIPVPTVGKILEVNRPGPASAHR
jgi:hypothetical protein